MKAIIRILGLLCAVVPQILAQQGMEPNAAAAIRALEHQWTVGQAHNDNRALDLIFDNALVYVEYGRLVPKADYLLQIKGQDAALDHIVMEPLQVRLFGTTAVVVGTYVEKRIVGVRHDTRRWRFLDTWVYKKNGWTLVAAGAAPVAN